MIQDVKYITTLTNLETGEPVELTHPYFDVTDENGQVMKVPPNAENRHYWEIKDWYERQENKPFEFNFLPLPDAPINE